MPPPKRVVLGPHEYPVQWVDKFPKDRGKIGDANRITNVIRVRTDQCGSNLRSTLLHEILHQSFWQTPMRHTAGWSDEVEEAIVTALESLRL